MKIKINIPDESYYLLKYIGVDPEEYCELAIKTLSLTLLTIMEKALKGEEITDELITETVRGALKDLLKIGAGE